jgi:hypothetical protein
MGTGIPEKKNVRLCQNDAILVIYYTELNIN